MRRLLLAIAALFALTSPSLAASGGSICDPVVIGQCVYVTSSHQIQVLTQPGTASGGSDPCTNNLKATGDFESTSSGGSIVTAVSGKKAYICSISILTSAAANVSLIEGTGSSVCTGGTPAGIFLNTGVTAANGAAFGANGGIQLGDGNATVAVNGTASYNVCVIFTTTNTPQVNVHVTYVQQ